jgi:O-antigen/teichoic acid export membrane protein
MDAVNESPRALPDGFSESGAFSTRFMVRFGATFVANVLRAGLSFLSGLLVARGLGPAGYGELSFLLGSFTAVSQLFEMGTSSAFYTFVARRPRGRVFFALYGGWMVFQFAATVLAVGVILPPGAIARIWLGHDRGIVLLACVASFLTNQIWLVLSQLTEAVRKTVVIQAASVAQAVVHLLLITAAAHWRWLTVTSVMWLLGAEYCVLALALAPRLVRDNYIADADTRDDVRSVITEFAGYCTPLIVYSWVSFLYVFADRWLLQRFGGPEQQGFFAIGQQFANISLIATSSVLRVFWKEIAAAGERGDHDRIRTLYLSVSRGMYCAGAWLSCLLIPYSRPILRWSAGPNYDAAWVALSILFLYPIHQSLGQITGTLFYASGKTDRYVKIGMTMMLISIPVTYVLLAPPSAPIPGFGLGAVGLALKMVVIQAIGVNLLAHLIARMSGIAFEWLYQAGVVGVLLALGWTCKWAAGLLTGLASTPNVTGMEIVLGSLLYAGGSLGLMVGIPGMTGLNRDQLRFALSKADWRRAMS